MTPATAWLLRPAGALLLAALVGLAGCAGGGTALSPDQHDLREEAARFGWARTQGAWFGAAGSALGGWLISEDARRGRGLLRYAAGYYVESVDESYADQQQAVAGRIAAADQDIARYERAAARARSVVTAHRQTIARLNDQYARGAVTADAYGRQIATIEGDAEALQELIRESAGNVELMDQDIAELREQGVGIAGLVARRNHLDARRDALQAQLDALASAVGSIPPAVGRPELS
jgi:hypothetical protein